MQTTNDELSEVFVDLSVAVFKADLSTINSLCEDGERRVRDIINSEALALLERLETSIDSQDGDDLFISLDAAITAERKRYES